MKPLRYSLNETVSFRAYDKFAIVIAHSEGLILRVNKTAADIIRRIESGEENFSDGEIKFISELQKAGVVKSKRESKTSERKRASKPLLSGSAETEIIDRLARYAQKRLIPVNAIIELTRFCPLNCIHCYCGPQKRLEDRLLTLKEFKRFADELTELGGLFMLFTGGEPFSHPQFLKMLDYARKKRFAVSVMTSGWGVKEETIKRMAEKGLDSVQVSIYGSSARTHDRFTGKKGSFGDAMNTLKKFRDLGVYAKAAVNINRQNNSEFEAIIALLEKEGLDFTFNFIVTPRLDGDYAPRNLNLSKEQILRLVSKYPPEDAPRLRRLSLKDKICGAASNQLALGPEGEVYPCLMIKQAAGNIRNQSLAEIWKFSKILKKYRNLKLANLIECPDCDIRAFCNRCTGNALLEGLEEKNHSLLDCNYACVLRSLSENVKEISK